MNLTWILNKNVIYDHIEFFDLFVDNEYQHIWVARDKRHDTYQVRVFGDPENHGPVCSTFDEAATWVSALFAIRKLEGKAV